MAESDAGEKPDRNWARTGLVLCSLLVVIAVATLMPAFGTDGVAGSPLEQILPGESTGETSADSRFGDRSGLGALNPGESTGVGGDVGLDSETFGNTETAVHFTVQSSQRTYWRTGAYDRYTGSGWERTGDSQPLDGSIEHDGIDDERIEWEIEFEQSATAVPTAWRPKAVDGVTQPQVTSEGAVRAGKPIEAGETVDGVSYSPQRDEGALRAAGDQYPPAVTDQYLQLPAESSQQIEEFTSELTADDETAYDQAVTIENWLEESKSYDLGVSERSDNIAETFIFEMEAGYCEYFATSMVTMLRSQDIPARYVVGYTGGQSVDENTYQVRGMNAHAWVEVYFEDIGWVRFDPTPSGPRLATQEQALESAGTEIDIDDIARQTELGEADPPSTDGFQAELNQTALPGEPVEVTVTMEGVPVVDELVYFNGEPVGTTDQDGTVVGTVPNARELVISVTDSARFRTTNVTNTQPTQQLGGGGVSPPATQDDDRTDTHPIERTATMSVSGDTVPGETVTVTVTAGDQLLDDATVTLDGTVVGQTDRRGQIGVTLPDRPGNVTLGAERGLVSGERAVAVSELTVSVESGRLPAMALSTVTVEARLGDEPATGVPVEIDGSEVATTGTDGTATVRLPARSRVTVAATGAGQTAQVVLTGLLLRSAIGLLFGITAVAVPLVALANRGYRPRDLGSVLRAVPGRLVATVQRALVVVATSGDEYLARTVALFGAIPGAVSAVVRGDRSLGEYRTGVAAWLSGARRRGVRWLAVHVPSGRATPAAGDEQPTVQAAWEQFLSEVSVESVETRTPGELAAHAVREDGLPEEPVMELRDTYREVEYGDRPPTDSVDRVEDAIRQITREDAE